MTTESTPSPVPGSFKDRKAGLVIFGVLTFLMGAFCALLIPLMLFGQAMAAKTAGTESSASPILSAIGVYGLLAVVLVWLGVGSIMARRWARALLLIFSWSWLITGVFSIAIMAMMIPQFRQAMESAGPTQQTKMPPEAQMGVLIFVGIFMLVIFFVLPLVWTLFYRSRHVKATCETRDPVPRWTDRIPLPVLAMVVWVLFGGLTMLLMPLAYRGVFPFFGAFVTGTPGTLLYLGSCLIWVYSAYALYKLDLNGWWLIVVAICVFSVSSVMTYMHHDVSEMYRLMGYSEQQMEQIQKFNFFKGWMPWSSLFFSIPFLGFLVYIRKFFNRPNDEIPAIAK